MGRRGDGTRRRLRGGAAAALLVGAGALTGVSAGCSGSTSDAVTVTETVAAADATDVPTTEASAAESDAAPAPQRLRGSGMRVVSMKVASPTPVVVAGTHTGSSNFIVEVLGEGSDITFNEIGAFTGSTLITGLSIGTHRVTVDADGAWTLTVTQPTPPDDATGLPGSITGKGQAVVWVRADESIAPIITGTHKGESNFIVDIVSADGSGAGNLFNEIGPFTGETTTGIPAGAYLIEIIADGSWSVRFAR